MARRKRQAPPAAADPRNRASTSGPKRRKTSGRTQATTTDPHFATQPTVDPAAPPTSIPAPALSTIEVRDACYALSKKLARDRQGRRQNGRRSKAEKFRLADNQKHLFAKAIKAARNGARAVDYDLLSNSCHFPTFRGRPDVLAAMEASVVAEMMAALEEQRAIDANISPVRSPAWREELARVNAAHKNIIADMEQRAESLVARLASSEALVEDLRAQLRGGQEVGLRADIQYVASPIVELRTDVTRSPAFKTRELAAFQERLHQREKLIQDKEDELAQLASTLDRQKTAVQEQSRALVDERQRLDGRKATVESLEQRHREKLVRDQELQEAWKQHQAAIEKELNRLISVLQEQTEAKGYGPTLDQWKSKVEVEKQISRASQSALENALRDTAQLRNVNADLRLQLASYTACGTTEHRIELFAKRFADPNHDDISTRRKQRKFAVKMMKQVRWDRGVELDADFFHFAEIRNDLCHDNEGDNLSSVPHADFHSLCRKIQSALGDLRQAFSQ